MATVGDYSLARWFQMTLSAAILEQPDATWIPWKER